MYRAVAAAALRIIGVPVIHAAELELLVQGLSGDGVRGLGSISTFTVYLSLVKLSWFWACTWRWPFVFWLRGAPLGLCVCLFWVFLENLLSMFVLSFACEFCVSLLRGRRGLPLGAWLFSCFCVCVGAVVVVVLVFVFFVFVFLVGAGLGRLLRFVFFTFFFPFLENTFYRESNL